VKSGHENAFLEATQASAKASISQEEGLIRYDILRVRHQPPYTYDINLHASHIQGEGENVNEFVLFEVFKTKKDIRRHKETRHYQKWRDTVESMMESPRDMKTFTTVFPTVSKWAYPSTSKRKKRKKDPNMPKRPPNAYMLFANDHRDKIRETNPDMNVSDISRELGVMWRGLDEEGKMPYQSEATKLTENYRVELNTYREEQKEIERRIEEEEEEGEEGL